MIIKSKDIIKQVEFILSKSIDDIKENDLNNITILNINRVNEFNEIEYFELNDLLLFKNLNTIIINNFEIDNKFLSVLNNIDSLYSISFNNCEFFDMSYIFDNITVLKICYCKNYFNNILNSFPNVSDLTLRGYSIDYIPDTVKVLDILNSNIIDIYILDNKYIDEISISQDEYKQNKAYYDTMNVKLYDDKNCHFIKKGSDS